MRDLFNNLEVSRAISPTRVTDNTAQVSQIIDMQGYDAMLFVILIGTLADANATFAVLVEDGDNSSLTDNAAVADAELRGTEAAAAFEFDDDDEVRKIGYLGDARYVRLTVTPSGNTGNADLAAVALQSKAENAPVNANAND